MIDPKNSYRVIAPPPLKAYSPEWFLDKYLAAWTSEDIHTAIKKNFKWDLSNWRDAIIDHVTGWFLDWAKTHRPDLYGSLSSTEGREWLKNNIRQAIMEGT